MLQRGKRIDSFKTYCTTAVPRRVKTGLITRKDVQCADGRCYCTPVVRAVVFLPLPPRAHCCCV